MYHHVSGLQKYQQTLEYKLMMLHTYDTEGTEDMTAKRSDQKGERTRARP